MIKDKFKFYSPFHTNYNFRLLYLVVFIMFLPTIYYDPISLIGLYPMFIILKITDWFNIMVEIRDSKRYIDWIDDLEKFKYIILSKYVFLVTVIIMMIYEFYIIFTTDSLFSATLSVLFTILLVLISSSFYENVLKLKK